MTDHTHELRSIRARYDPCTSCGADVGLGQWWHLNNYHGLSGLFCPSCYAKVSHDAYGNPRHPEQFAEVVAGIQTRGKQ